MLSTCYFYYFALSISQISFMMKLITNVSRQAVFAAALLSLVVYISCKGTTVGPIPNYDYTQTTDQEVAPTYDAGVDTTTIQAADINVTASTISNAKTEDFSQNVTQASNATDVATLQSVATEVSSSLNNTQETYWQNLDQSTIQSRIENGNSTMTSQLSQMQTVINGNSTLSAYLPSTSNPTSGRIASGGRTTGEIEVESSAYGIDATNADVTSCLQAWTDWATTAIDGYKAIRDTYLGSITKAFSKEKAKLDKQKSDAETAFANTYATRITYFIGLWSSAATNIQNAVSAGKLTSSEGTFLLMWNNIILGINISKSYELYQQELSLTTTAYNNSLAALNTIVTNMKNTVNNNYNNAVKAVQAIVKEKTADCHDQGTSHDQGGN